MKIIIKNCPYCNSKVLYKETSIIVYGRDFGPIYHCSKYPKCDAYVGCHKQTDIPFGQLANRQLRLWRRNAHLHFDVLWKNKIMKRKEAYRWLSKQLKINYNDCHIGLFDIKLCKKVIHICQIKTPNDC